MSLSLALGSAHISNLVEETGDHSVELMVILASKQATLNEIDFLMLMTTSDICSRSLKYTSSILVHGPSNHKSLETKIYLDAIDVLKDR